MPDFNIPQAILQQFFPSQNLTIIKFLSYEFPQATDKSPTVLTEDNYISSNQPNASTNDIHSLLSTPAPSSPVVQDLLYCIRSAPPPTARSVAHRVSKSVEIKHFPLWIVTYWNELNHILEDRRCWLLADQTLKTLCLQGTTTRELVDTVYQTLSNMPWSGSIHGFSDRDEIIHLHKYATTDWLTTVHENQMLNLLKHDISNHHTNLTQVIIQSTYFIQTLYQSFHHSHHCKGLHMSYLHDTWQSLTTSSKVYLRIIVNCLDTHWVALVMDFSDRVIWHGDSLDGPVETELKCVLEWWIQEHESALFIYKKLPITYQKDDFSCGLLSWNALSHFFLPTHHPLIHPSNVATVRLDVLLRICKQHQNEGHNLPNSAYRYVISLPEFSLDGDDSDFKIRSHVTDFDHLDDDNQPSSSYSSDDNDDDSSLPNNDSSVPDDLQAIKKPDVSSSAQVDKIKIESSVRKALENKTAPLLAFFQRCSQEEYNANLAKDQQIVQDERESMQGKEKVIQEQNLLQKRELAMLRQHRHRDRKQEKDIIVGIHSPGGTKCKIVELMDPGISKKLRMDLPEETRPARLLERKIHRILTSPYCTSLC